jgi:hypothetical protein
MLLGSLVLGPQHIQNVANSHYLDPSPAVQRAWSEGTRGATVYATVSSSVSVDGSKLK